MFHLSLLVIAALAAVSCESTPPEPSAVAAETTGSAAKPPRAQVPTCILPGEEFFRGTYGQYDKVLPEKLLRLREQGGTTFLVREIRGGGPGYEYTCDAGGMKVRDHEVAFVDANTVRFDGEDYTRVKGEFDADDYASAGCPEVGSRWISKVPTGTHLGGGEAYSGLSFKAGHADLSNEDTVEAPAPTPEGT